MKLKRKLLIMIMINILLNKNLITQKSIAHFMKKTECDDKLKNRNLNFTSNKTKDVLVENKLNELSKKLKQHQQKDQSNI